MSESAASQTPIERHFLGWDRPLLEACVEWLSREGHLPHEADDARQRFALVVPGSRAGRRLLEALAIELAGRNFIPPPIVTPAQLLSLLLPCTVRVARPMESTLAWRQAVAELAGRPELVEALGPIWDRPSGSMLDDLAAEVRAVSDELGAEGLDIEAASNQLSRAEAELDQHRWQTLRAVERRYREVLSRAGLVCPHAERVRLLTSAERSSERRVVLVGVAELPGLVRHALDSEASRVDALIGAPETVSDGFDRWGQPNIDFWQDRSLRLDPARRSTSEDLDGMIGLAVDDVPASPGGTTLGVGDQQLLPALCDELELREVPFHSPIGRTYASSRPAVAMRLVARFAESGSLEDLGALLRCPDLESWLQRELAGDWPVREEARDAAESTPPRGGRAERALAGGDWLTALDEYATSTLAIAVPESGGRDSERWLRAIEGRILDGLVEDEEQRPVSVWANVLADALREWFGGEPLDLSEPGDAELVAALERSSEVFHALRELPNALDRRLSLSETLGLILEAGGHSPLASSTSDPDGVEILGWLELALDDAEHLVVMGLNEGVIPAKLGAQGLLPPQARRWLGLPDEARRFARDAFLLEGLVRSRSRVLLLSAVSGHDGEPLLPSRLLLQRPAEELPALLRSYYATTPSIVWAPSQRRDPEPPPLVFGNEVPDALPVTAFRDYLACPYRFYLRRLHGAQAVRDRPRELEGGSFGSLAHEVLSRFAGTELARSTEPEFVEAGLLEILDRVVEQQLAADVGPAVRVQIAQLRHRLGSFASWQCTQVLDGWEIDAALCEVDLEAPLEVDGERLWVRGRVDRVDRHPVFGLRLLDYKTSDSPKSPKQTHRRGGEWFDLQLPLYRYLMEARGLSPKTLGFVQLSKKHRQPDLMAPAEWPDEEHEAALDKARWVVRQLRQSRYWPPGEPPDYLDGLEHLAGDSLPSRWRLGALARGPGWPERGDSDA
ncbi:MAG: PD-(D/E)XK nuclease family protein [Acidobacteriota bacterium]